MIDGMVTNQMERQPSGMLKADGCNWCSKQVLSVIGLRSSQITAPADVKAPGV